LKLTTEIIEFKP